MIEIRALDERDTARYIAFRRQMWPASAAAGDWETIHIKYFQNPLLQQCPAAGLYGAIDGRDLLGTWGAYPMPVTVNGSTFPGHLLVDSYVLPHAQKLPVGALLFRTVQNLPGRKYASYGAEYLQAQLARVATRIELSTSVAIWGLIPALLLRLFRLGAYQQPCALALGEASLGPDVQFVTDPMAISPEEPQDPVHTAYVKRDAAFWAHYCNHRVKNGAVAVRVQGRGAQARIVFRLEQVGPIRIGALMSLQVTPHTPQAAADVAGRFRSALSRLDICAMTATEPDTVYRSFQNALGIYVRRGTAHWWGIPRKDDTFAASDVRWHLTLADRDSQWGYIQPSLQH